MSAKIEEKRPFLVYTSQRMQAGQPPLVVWSSSAKMLVYRFTRKYHVHPLKVVPAKFNVTTSTWSEK